MSMPDVWLNRLFDRLVLRYGESFLRQYGDLNPAAVKADWADVLDGFKAESIRWALQYLPADRPPNAMQFRDLCRRSPSGDAVEKLPAPKPDPDRVRRMLQPLIASMACRNGDETPAQRCMSSISSIVAQRGYMSAAQRHQVQAIQAMWDRDVSRTRVPQVTNA
jgi:hypothetical protein